MYLILFYFIYFLLLIVIFEMRLLYKDRNKEKKMKNENVMIEDLVFYVKLRLVKLFLNYKILRIIKL